MNAILELLRSLKGRCIGSIEENSAADTWRSTERGGSFLSVADFNFFLRRNAVSKTPKIYLSVARLMSDTHRLVFTHEDLSPGNVIIPEGRDVGLLVWECIAGYSEYWEYVRFIRNAYTSIDWHEYANITFTNSVPQRSDDGPFS